MTATITELLIPTLGHQYILQQLVNTPEFSTLYKGPTDLEKPDNLPVIRSYKTWADTVSAALTRSRRFVSTPPHLQKLLRAATTPIDRLCLYIIIYYETRSE